MFHPWQLLMIKLVPGVNAILDAISDCLVGRSVCLIFHEGEQLASRRGEDYIWVRNPDHIPCDGLAAVLCFGPIHGLYQSRSISSFGFYKFFDGYSSCGSWTDSVFYICFRRTSRGFTIIVHAISNDYCSNNNNISNCCFIIS